MWHQGFYAHQLKAERQARITTPCICQSCDLLIASSAYSIGMKGCGASAGVAHPKLALILRYLAFTHSTMQQDDPSAPELSADDGDTDQIISNLLGSDRDPAPLPAEGVPQVWHSFRVPLPCLQ